MSAHPIGRGKWPDVPLPPSQDRVWALRGLSWPKWVAWAGFLCLVVAAFAVGRLDLAVGLYVIGFLWLFGIGAVGVHRLTLPPPPQPELPQDHRVRLVDRRVDV